MRVKQGAEHHDAAQSISQGLKVTLVDSMCKAHHMPSEAESVTHHSVQSDPGPG